MSGAPGRHSPQVCPPPLRADPMFCTGPAPRTPVRFAGHPSPDATRSTATQSPKGRKAQTSLLSRGAAEASGGTTAARVAARPSRRSGPRAHSRSRHSTLAGSGFKLPHLLAFQIARARVKATVRPARMDPGPSFGLGRTPTAPKASQGLTKGIAQVRSSQHRLQDQ
ncbi:hypothetical protein NDU88_005745 [Pleurodeles waltl]|uniref:Uncharacterized protein n=1 Tax=Pleurodeles waltl TaxID=8319 RepID=A0AAV7TWG3_PLEWA|nr:hypothetical protein NDU88_005745 [Pleurodeles waltl]